MSIEAHIFIIIWHFSRLCGFGFGNNLLHMVPALLIRYIRSTFFSRPYAVVFLAFNGVCVPEITTYDTIISKLYQFRVLLINLSVE